MTGAKRTAITNTDDTHRSKASRLAVRLETPPYRSKQGLRHGMPAARPADQDRVAIFHKACRFVRQ